MEPSMPTLSIERAQALNDAMLALGLEREGLGRATWAQITMLREASLVELAAVEAIMDQDNGEVLADGSRRISLKCDQRLVAAIYTFLHFALPPAHTVDHEDYLILRTSDRSGYTAFLVCGVRETASLQHDGDEQETAE